jgi:uncharacterized protein YaiL (DUF2058 family)
MGSLRDQLVKTGLADDKRARQLAHDEKARKNKLGRDAIVAEKHAEEEERRSRDAAKREQDRAREAERSRGETAREATARAAQLLRDHLLRDGVKGPRRFHFVTRRGAIPFLELSEDAAKRLEAGGAAICEVPGAALEEFVLVPADVARRLKESHAAWVLFLNEGRTEP